MRRSNSIPDALHLDTVQGFWDEVTLSTHRWGVKKKVDLIDKFNDTSRYLDDIFTIDNPVVAEQISDIYPRELQLKKAKISDKNIFLGFKYQSYWQ